MKEEKRHRTRIDYFAHALVTSRAGETLKGVIRDIGMESVYMYIGRVFETNEPVNVEIILLAANSQLTIKVLAKVVRTDEYGIAMRFLSPLEWWPIFTYFPTHELDYDDIIRKKLPGQQGEAPLKPAAFQGDLAVITIENLMQLVSHAALSGELHLTTSDNTARFFVHEGTLEYGYLENNPLRIGRRLIEENYISEEQLRECLALYQDEASQPKIGKILVDRGYLRQSDLETVIKLQIKSIFFEVLSWHEGYFTFSIKKVLEDDKVLLEERIDHLILEGIIHLDNQ